MCTRMDSIASIARCRLELLEAAGCSVLACTVAWDAEAGHGRPQRVCGFVSFAEAAADALRALSVVRMPRKKTAPAVRVGADSMPASH